MRRPIVSVKSFSCPLVQARFSVHKEELNILLHPNGLLVLVVANKKQRVPQHPSTNSNHVGGPQLIFIDKTLFVCHPDERNLDF